MSKINKLSILVGLTLLSWGYESPHCTLLDEIDAGMRVCWHFFMEPTASLWVRGRISQKGLRGPLLPTHKCFVFMTLGEIKNKRWIPC